MADQMTTRRRAARAAGTAAGTAAQPPAQQGSATVLSPFMTGALPPPLINVQPPDDTRSSRSSRLSSSEPDNDILPALPDIPNPEKLTAITILKLKDNNFRE